MVKLHLTCGTGRWLDRDQWNREESELDAHSQGQLVFKPKC